MTKKLYRAPANRATRTSRKAVSKYGHALSRSPEGPFSGSLRGAAKGNRKAGPISLSRVRWAEDPPAK